MTATATTRPAAGARAAEHDVSFRGVVAAELIKFRSLRSTVAVLGAAMLGMVVIGLILAYNTRHLTASIDPNDAVASSPLQGYYLAQLLIGALGVLTVSSEYSSGMIRASFAAVPRRQPVVLAKLLVFVMIVFPAMLVMSFVSFLAAEGLISHYRTGFSLSDPGVLRVVIGTAVYLTLIGVLGLSLGWIVRSTPGGLVSFVALLLVVPVLFGNVLGQWGKDVAQYLPSQAGGAFVQTIPEPPSLSPWVGLLVLVVWAVVAVVLGAWQVRRCDA